MVFAAATIALVLPVTVGIMVAILVAVESADFMAVAATTPTIPMVAIVAVPAAAVAARVVMITSVPVILAPTVLALSDLVHMVVLEAPLLALAAHPVILLVFFSDSLPCCLYPNSNLGISLSLHP